MNSDIIMTAKGVNGQIDLLNDKIRILRKGMVGFLTQGIKGDKEILISQISSIQYKKAGAFANGYIQFAFMGGREAKGGILQATKDENTVMFKKGAQAKQFDLLKARIDFMRNEISASSNSINPVSNLDELEKLASLKDKGIVTDEEFDAKKKQLLGL